jgi:hypothetical protein
MHLVRHHHLLADNLLQLSNLGVGGSKLGVSVEEADAQTLA